MIGLYFLMRDAPRSLILLLLALAVFSGAGRAVAQGQEESQLKAAFLFNFAKFVEWPPEAFGGASSPVVLAILGDDSKTDAFEALQGKALGDRKLIVKRIKKIEEIEGVNIVCICSSERDRLGQILKTVEGKPILTVSDVGNFVRQGGIIGFVSNDNKVRFEINLKTARKARLEISSKLLKLAETVVE